MGNYLRLAAIFLSLLPTLLRAQHPTQAGPAFCGTPNLTVAERQAINQQAAVAYEQKRAKAAFTSITYVPIRPHILRKSNGTGGMDLASLNQVMAITNSYYLLNGYGIQFYFCGTSPDYVDNDGQYDNMSDEETVTRGHDVSNALNQYYVNSFISGAGGYAYYPGNFVASTRSFILNETWSPDDMGNRLIPHELGHNFNLVHTFGEVSGNGTLNSGTTTELVTRGTGANCTTDGDYVCDTPADPYNNSGARLVYVNGCVQYDSSSTARDANGEAYSPSLSNIMSYYFPCTHNFTPGQYDRMQAGLALRQTHTAYTLDCAPTPVAAPTNLVASLDNSNIVLSWRDNATNEMGYFIERSLSPSENFIPIGGVGPNTTTFTDSRTAPFTKYYYRLRPSNATTSGLSQVISIQTLSCHPTYLTQCSETDGISSVAVNGVMLSQNTMCMPGSYSSFTTTTTSVRAGMSYSISGTLLNPTFPEGVTVWADLDRNGIFDSGQGEQLFQTPTTVTGQFSGTISLPASLSVGALPIRVTIAYATIPTDPCGTYNYGETEDYVLTVVQQGSTAQPMADLNLDLRQNRIILGVNQPVSYSLIVRNDGPDNATGIQWQNRLPEGLLFVSGGTDVSAAGALVTGGSSFSLAVGQSRTFTYQLQPSLAGMYVNAAQISSSDQTDPDSQPGSGTGDGQDDAAAVSMRTMAGSNAIYASPNPNQMPMPAVISNQPLPDPTKADLSVAIMANQRVPTMGQPVTFTLSVSNMGGVPATNVIVRDTLRGMALQSLPLGLNVISNNSAYTLIEGTIAALAVNTVTQWVFTATIGSSTAVNNSAQIWATDTPDADSVPGSLTPMANNFNGEDDIAWIDFRIR
ncbi:GEVED domain-containing protein [Spirosoma koreense]